MRNAIIFTFVFSLFFNLSFAEEVIYQSDFTTTAGKKEWKQYRCGYKHQYSQWSMYGKLVHDYPVYMAGMTDTDTTKDWIVSPLIKYSTAQIKINFSLFSMSGATMPFDRFQIWASHGSRNPADGDFFLLGDMTTAITGSDVYVDSIYNLTSLLGPDSCYIAILYQTVNNWYVPTISSVTVWGRSINGIEESNDKAITVSTFSYSATSSIDITINKDVSESEFTLFSISGEKILTQTMNCGTNQVYVPSISSGIYFYTISSDAGLIRKGILHLIK